MSSPPPDLLAYHRNNNRATAPSWDDFSSHRERVTRLALEAAPDAGGRLAVLGAGNCNDVDLGALAARYQEVHLIDVDLEAVRRAKARALSDVASRLVLHAPVDLTGSMDRLAAFRQSAPTAAQLGALSKVGAEKVLAALPGGFDVTLSACLLSQLMHTCYLALGAKHPGLQLTAYAVSVAHLRSLAGLLAPGGTGLLVTDTISSETYAIDELWAGRDPIELLGEVDRTGRVLSGTGPAQVRGILIQDQLLSETVTPPRLIPPWRWRLASELTYLVYAYAFRRRA
jgi:hypothetical protein